MHSASVINRFERSTLGTEAADTKWFIIAAGSVTVLLTGGGLSRHSVPLTHSSLFNLFLPATTSDTSLCSASDVS